MNRDTIINVTNRSVGRVGYDIPELHITRRFNHKETKQITFGELMDLSMQPGGMSLLMRCLYLDNKEAVRAIMNGDVEPEYWLTEDKIPEWLRTSSLDAFKDALDFAPDGVKDLIKKYAVSTELNDMNKRQAILDILHFDVTKAISVNKDAKEGVAEEAPAQRRVSVNSAPTYRRVTSEEKKGE